MNHFIRQHRSRISVFILHSAFVTVCLLMPATGCRLAFGEERKLIPSCEFKEEFNDNVFLSASDKKSDFITTISPSVAFSSASERLNIELLSGLSWHEYVRSEGIGSMDYQLNAQVANRLTQLDDIGLSAAYARNTRPDSISQTSGLSSSTGSDHYQISASARRLVTETSSASLTYSFVQDDYDNPVYQANHVHNAGLVISKDFSALAPLLKGTLSSNFSRATYRDSRSDSYTLTAGASRSITERILVSLSAGGQVIHSTFETTSEGNNESWGAVGSALVNFTGENTFGSFSIARNFSAASGQIGAVESTSFGLTLGHNYSDKITAQFAASYNINHASNGQFSSQGTDARALSLKAGIMYKISKNFDAGFQYAYYTVSYAPNDLIVAQNSVMLRVVAKYPVNW
jgi:hypothetical protein